jgi:hypothetical protein
MPAGKLSVEQQWALVLAASSSEGPTAPAGFFGISAYCAWKLKNKALRDAQEQAEFWRWVWGLEAVGEATM